MSELEKRLRSLAWRSVREALDKGEPPKGIPIAEVLAVLDHHGTAKTKQAVALMRDVLAELGDRR